MQEIISLWYQGSKKGKLVYGPSPKQNTLESIMDNHTTILNVRPPSDTATWYKNQLSEAHTKKFCWGYKDATKKETFYRLCCRMAERIYCGERVYVHGYSEDDVAGAVALGILYLIHADPNFDPVQHVREQGHFEIAVQRFHRDMIKYVENKRPRPLVWSKFSKTKL